jgi:hypothetical protein
MKILQHKNGSAELIFSDDEIKALNKDKKLTMSAEVLKHFGNCLVKIVADWNENFTKEVKDLLTSNPEE